MNKIYLYFFEPFNNLSKRLYITIITILFLAAFIFFLGVFSNVFNSENMTLSLRNNETYLSYHQMYFGVPIEDIMAGKRGEIWKELNNLSRNNMEKRRQVDSETDSFICKLYNMQSDSFILEYCAFYEPYIDGLPELFDQSIVKADQAFFEHEYLPIFKGRGITKEDFEEIKNSKTRDIVISVLAGYSYMDYYEIGDVLKKPIDDYTKEYYGYDSLSEYSFDMSYQEFASYRIVGFLEKGITFSNASGSIHQTDSFVFVPCFPSISVNFPGETTSMTSGIDQYKILIQNDKTDEYADIINREMKGLFIDNYYNLLDSYQKTYDILGEVVSARNDSFIVIAVFLFIFSVSGIIVSTVNKFKRNILSYTVHLTVGATNRDIYIFSAVEMLMQIIIAFAIAHIPYLLSFVDMPVLRFINRNIPYMRSSAMYLLILMFSLIFIAVTVAVTAWCMKKYSIAETLKGKE